jgi:hypothetical protein
MNRTRFHSVLNKHSFATATGMSVMLFFENIGIQQLNTNRGLLAVTTICTLEPSYVMLKCELEINNPFAGVFMPM